MASSSQGRRRTLGVAIVLAASIVPATAGSQESPAEAPGLVDRAQRLATAIDGELTSRAAALGGARVGIAVRDLASGQLVFARDLDGGYNLASNTKVVTAAAALAGLGPGFAWRTGLYAERLDPKTGEIAGDLYLRGGGNPTLRTADLDALAADLRDLGVSRIRGHLVVDDGYFDAVDSPPHFDEQPSEQAYFRAPIAATSVNFDAVRLLVRPAPSGAGPARASIEPPSDYAVLKSEVQTVASGRSRVRVESKVVAGKLELTVRGQIRADDRPVTIRRRVPDPRAYVTALLRQRLAARGVRVDGKTPRSGKVPTAARLLAEHESPPLAVVLRDLGKHSNNYVAEMILKTLGAETVARGQRPASWDDALGAVRHYLVDEVGLAPDSFYVGNGSGLFGGSKFSPAQLVRLLEVAWRDYRYGPDLVASLSIAGVDGTIGHRMSTGPAARRVRAKTGTLTGVSTLSGYLALDSRAPLAFAILINGEAKNGAARALQDAICELLVRDLETRAPGASDAERPGPGPGATAAEPEPETEPE